MTGRPSCWRQPRWPLLLLAGLAWAQSGAAQAPVAHSPVDVRPSALQAVRTYLRAQMHINRIPAVSVAIVHAGRTELLESYGVANLEWGVPATTATAYQLASATKPLTGTALMLLVQAGRLALDQSARTYLPDAPTEWQRISIRHLATHTSGISDDLGDAASAEEATRRLLAVPLLFEPGSRTSYGIGGYAVLQHIIERVIGVPFDRFLRDRLLAPLGMTSTHFDHSSDEGPFRIADLVARRAGIYASEGAAQRIFWLHYTPAAYTAGGLLATAEDLAKWAAELDAGELLTPQYRDQMWQSTGAEPGGAAFGIGWALGRYRGRPTAGHSGGPALADVLRFTEEKLTIIVLANQSRMYPYLAQGVADIIVATTAPVPAAIADSEPQQTQRIRQLLLSLSEGEVPDEGFTEEARRGFVPQVRNFLPPYTRALGSASSVSLVEEVRQGGRWERTYHVSYAGKPVLWKFELAVDGRVQSMRPFPQ